MIRQKKLAAGTNSSVVVDHCQVCDSTDLESVIFIGYLPPVNAMPAIGSRPAEQPAYPAEVLRCRKCQLVQIGLIVDPAILFPPTYPYTSGTTKILRENFAELSSEVERLYPLKPSDLIVDVGSNDGTLLSNFTRFCRVYSSQFFWFCWYGCIRQHIRWICIYHDSNGCVRDNRLHHQQWRHCVVLHKHRYYTDHWWYGRRHIPCR